MKGLSAKALSMVPFTDDFPPCVTMRQVFLADVLFANLAAPPLQQFRRPVTDIERATVKQARKAEFVLVEKVTDGWMRSYGSIRYSGGGKKGGKQ